MPCIFSLQYLLLFLIKTLEKGELHADVSFIRRFTLLCLITPTYKP